MNRVQPLYANAELTVDLFDHPLHETREDPGRLKYSFGRTAAGCTPRGTLDKVG